MPDVFLQNNSAFFIWILSAATIVALLYYYTQKELSLLKKSFLAILRTLALTGIGLLLWNPIWKTEKSEEYEKDYLAFFDVSSSLDSFSLDSLFLKEELRPFYFADRVQKNRTLVNPQSTNLASPMHFMREAFPESQVQAAVIFSDGIHNASTDLNWIEMSSKIPIHTVFLGDSSKEEDRSIVDVLYNHKVYLGNTAQIQVAWFRSSASLPMEIVLSRSGKVTQRKKIDELANFGTQTFEIPSIRVGKERITVQLLSFDDEKVLSNNNRQFQLETVEEKTNVLCVLSDIHPDNGYLIRALDRNPSVELEYRSTDKITSTLMDWADVVVCLGFKQQDVNVFSALKLAKKPLAFFLRAGSHMPENILPLSSGSTQKMGKYIEGLLAISPSFSLLPTNPSLWSGMTNCPPIQVPLTPLVLESALPVFYPNLENTLQDKAVVQWLSSPPMMVSQVEQVWSLGLCAFAEDSNRAREIEMFWSDLILRLSKEGEDETIDLWVKSQGEVGVKEHISAVVVDALGQNRIDQPLYIRVLDSINQSILDVPMLLRGNVYHWETLFLDPGNYQIEVYKDAETVSRRIISIYASSKEKEYTAGIPQNLRNISSKTQGIFFSSLQEWKEFQKILTVEKNSINFTSWSELRNQEWLYVFILLCFLFEWSFRRWWALL